MRIFVSQKLQAWCQLSNGDWVLGTIISSGSESVISLPDGEVSVSSSHMFKWKYPSTCRFNVC